MALTEVLLSLIAFVVSAGFAGGFTYLLPFCTKISRELGMITQSLKTTEQMHSSVTLLHERVAVLESHHQIPE